MVEINQRIYLCHCRNTVYLIWETFVLKTAHTNVHHIVHIHFSLRFTCLKAPIPLYIYKHIGYAVSIGWASGGPGTSPPPSPPGLRGESRPTSQATACMVTQHWPAREISEEARKQREEGGERKISRKREREKERCTLYNCGDNGHI